MMRNTLMRPIAAILLGLAILAFFAPWIQQALKKRRRRGVLLAEKNIQNEKRRIDR